MVTDASRSWILVGFQRFFSKHILVQIDSLLNNHHWLTGSLRCHIGQLYLVFAVWDIRQVFVLFAWLHSLEVPYSTDSRLVLDAYLHISFVFIHRWFGQSMIRVLLSLGWIPLFVWRAEGIASRKCFTPLDIAVHRVRASPITQFPAWYFWWLGGSQLSLGVDWHQLKSWPIIKASWIRLIFLRVSQVA